VPRRPQSTCPHPGCTTTTPGGRCDAHRRDVDLQRWQQADQNRPSARQRGYNTRWEKARKTYLARHPLCACVECKAGGRVRVATVVDHVVPHRGDQALFWDTSNWQAMAKTCHDRKTAGEEGGWRQEGRGRWAPPEQ
jgi:5-methylcytosine-specific restriction protein A